MVREYKTLEQQIEILKPTLSEAVSAVEYYLTDGIEKAQNIFNNKTIKE